MIWGDPKCWSALFPMEAIAVLMDCATGWVARCLAINGHFLVSDATTPTSCDCEHHKKREQPTTVSPGIAWVTFRYSV